MHPLERYVERASRAVLDIEYPSATPGLYLPVRYAIEAGGKRIRPAILLAVADWLGVDERIATPAAVAIEVFHNFTLLHDDVMDRSDLRRGHPTVRAKWDENRAILSGDAMVFLATRQLEALPATETLSALRVFNRLALEVCQGQQLDMEFEQREEVTLDEYFEMISLKTAALLQGSLELAGVLAHVEQPVLASLRKYALGVGLAFQLQDDLLDVYGDTFTFGKECGDDICDAKRTFLSIYAHERADANQRAELHRAMHNGSLPRAERVATAIKVYDSLGVKEATMHAIDEHFEAAREALREAETMVGKPCLPLAELINNLDKRES